MKSATVAMTGCLLFCLTGCNAYIEKSKYEESQRELQKTRAELEETKKQLQEAQKQINDLPAHKFSTYRDGPRTWRFDSATGQTCILLAPEWDWKNKETKSQSCACINIRTGYLKAFDESKDKFGKDKFVIDMWSAMVKDTCGE
jgi:hypothetical protein